MSGGQRGVVCRPHKAMAQMRFDIAKFYENIAGFHDRTVANIDPSNDSPISVLH